MPAEDDSLATTHYRWRKGHAMACGIRHGCATDSPDQVQCPACRAVANLAVALADRCGCREANIHAPVALVQLAA